MNIVKKGLEKFKYQKQFVDFYANKPSIQIEEESKFEKIKKLIFPKNIGIFRSIHKELRSSRSVFVHQEEVENIQILEDKTKDLILLHHQDQRSLITYHMIKKKELKKKIPITHIVTIILVVSILLGLLLLILSTTEPVIEKVSSKSQFSTASPSQTQRFQRNPSDHPLTRHFRQHLSQASHDNATKHQNTKSSSFELQSQLEISSQNSSAMYFIYLIFLMTIAVGTILSLS